jgi:replication factor A1
MNGKPEINLGTRGNITVSPTSIKPNNYPKIQDFFKKIIELKKEKPYVNIVGNVRKISPINTFTKSDQTQGRLAKVTVSDKTGIITVLFWNDNVNQITRLKQGNLLKIIGASVRKGIDEKLEINIGKYTKTEIITEQSSDHEINKIFFKINEIEPDLQDISLVARVVHIGEKKKFKRFNKKIGQRMVLLLRDETGYIRLTLWNEKADVSGIAIGDTVLIKRAYSRSGYRRVDLNLGISGNVIINPNIPETKSLPPPISILPIKDIQEHLDFVSIEGVLITSSSNEVMTRYGKTVTVSNLKIQDNTGEIRVSLWETLANYIVDLPTLTQIRIKNAYIKTGLNGEIQLSSGYPTSIEIISNQDYSDS